MSTPDGWRLTPESLRQAMHDVRTPLTVIGGYVDLLRTGAFGDMPDGADKPFGVIVAKLEEVEHLVDELHQAARRQSGVAETIVG